MVAVVFSLSNCLKFFPGLFSGEGPEKHPLLLGNSSALAQGRYHLQRCWSPALGGSTANPAGFAKALLFGYLRRAAAPAPAQVCASRFSFRVSPAAPARGRAAFSGAGTAGSPGGAPPELGSGARESPEEDGLRTQHAELLQSPQKGNGRRRRSLPREGRRVRNRSAAGTLGAAGPLRSSRGAGRRTARGRRGGRRGKLRRAALLAPVRG